MVFCVGFYICNLFRSRKPAAVKLPSPISDCVRGTTRACNDHSGRP